MFNSRWIKMGLAMVATVAVIAVALVWLVDTSAAQGPGGRGDNGRGGNGIGIQAQDGSCTDTGTCIGTGTGQQLGGNGYGAGGQNGNMYGDSNYQNRLWLTDNLPPATPGELPDDVIAALTAGIQDEYNAYATYQAVIDQFGAVRPFTGIQTSEAHHIDMLAFLFERYDLAVPGATGIATPVFASVQDACAASAAAEVANFSLYDQWIATVQDYPDIVQVFTMLRDASEFQHLPAFERCAG